MSQHDKTLNSSKQSNPIMTINNQNGQITIKTEVITSDQAMNETIEDLQRLLNVSQEPQAMALPSENNSLAVLEEQKMLPHTRVLSPPTDGSISMINSTQ